MNKRNSTVIALVLLAALIFGLLHSGVGISSYGVTINGRKVLGGVAYVDELRAVGSSGLKLYDDSGSGGIIVLDGGNVSASGVITTTALEVHGSINITTTDGIDYTPGSDTDVDLITVNVSGTPRFYWDETTNGFSMTHSLAVPGASLNIGTVTLSDSDGCLHTDDFHAEGTGGISGYFKMKQGTTPTAHKEADHSILWVDSSEKLQLEKADGTDLEVGFADNFIKKDGSVALTSDWDIGDARKILADEIRARDGAGLKLFDDAGNGIFVKDGGNIGINTSDPKRQFDFDGANVRTQRYLDSDTNTNLGYDSFGAGNLTGMHNSVLGRLGLYSITSGAGNCGLGNEVLYGVTTGGNNVGIANFAGKLIAGGGHNINIGYKSGYAITAGNNNISIGSYSNYVGTGSKNIIIGYNIDLPIDAGDNQLNIGNLIYGTGLDGVDKGVSTGKIGIGVIPTEKLDVAGNIKVSGNLTNGSVSLTVANAKTAYDHISLTNNPHSVTKSQVGLGNVPNTNIAYASAIAAGSFNSTEVANLRSAKLDDGTTPWIMPADDFNQTEVDNLRAGKLDNGTTPWLGRYSYSQHPATSTWTSSGQVDYMEIRYYLQRWQYKIMHSSYGAAYIRNFRLSDANPYTTAHDVNPTVGIWDYFSSSASYDSLYNAGDYVELRIYSDNAGFQGVVTVKAMRNGNDLIAFTLSQGVVD